MLAPRRPASSTAETAAGTASSSVAVSGVDATAIRIVDPATVCAVHAWMPARRLRHRALEAWELAETGSPIPSRRRHERRVQRRRRVADCYPRLSVTLRCVRRPGSHYRCPPVGVASSPSAGRRTRRTGQRDLIGAWPRPHSGVSASRSSSSTRLRRRHGYGRPSAYRTSGRTPPLRSTAMDASSLSKLVATCRRATSSCCAGRRAGRTGVGARRLPPPDTAVGGRPPEAGRAVVRVPPKLMAGARRSAREPGKSDPIDALSVARAALREPDLPVARLDGIERTLRLLVDHREDLVRDRTRRTRHACAGSSSTSASRTDVAHPWPPGVLAHLERQLGGTARACRADRSRDLLARIRELTAAIDGLAAEIRSLVTVGVAPASWRCQAAVR